MEGLGLRIEDCRGPAIAEEDDGPASDDDWIADDAVGANDLTFGFICCTTGVCRRSSYVRDSSPLSF